MRVTFLSNYINHHQIPFSNTCYKLLGEDYRFIQTVPMEQERINMGWSQAGEKLPYVCRLYEEEERCVKLIMESDVLLAGWSQREDLVQERLNAGKLTVRISERIYREGQWKVLSPRGLIHKYREHIRYRNQPAYLLCAGAYVPSDFHLIGAYPDKMFKWGYFPETRHYTEEELDGIKGDEKVLTNIVWAGRFIPLKHPEYMLRLGAALKGKEMRSRMGNRRIHIHMVGGGEMEEELRKSCQTQGLEEIMIFHGFKSPEETRDIMAKCHIAVFTSNHLEGWGAVVNEEMNSGCAVVANIQAGAVPYLIRQKENGMVYPDNDYKEMEKAVRYLLDHPGERKMMGRRAYWTIVNSWNGENGAKELIRMLEGLLKGKAEPAAEGPLSVAPVIQPGKMVEWMRKDSEGRGIEWKVPESRF